MRRFILMFLAVAYSAAVDPTFANDTTYKDPRQPSFTLLVPDGWTVVKTERGVDLKHGETAEVTLFVQGQAIDPSDFMRQVLPQIQQQHKNFRVIEQGACLFGRQSGSYIIYSGIGPKGPALTTKMVAMSNGQLTYVMVEDAPPDKYDDEKVDMQRIQDSFNPEATGPTGESPEKLDALHAAGVLTDEEYASRKRGESTFTDTRQPPYSIAVPAGWTSMKNDSGVKLEKQPAGSGVVQVWVQPGSHEPAAVIANTAPQFEKQWKNFQVQDRGEVRFGGLKGAYEVFSGEGTSGKPLVMKVVTTTDGKFTFMMLMMTDQDKYNDIKRDWDRIQQSFTLGEVAPSR
jgi:hypothetical protein